MTTNTGNLDSRSSVEFETHGVDPDQSFERFEDALRTVLTVPKDEVVKDFKREKKEREARRKD